MATVKQRRALAKLVENGGNVSKAMRDVGYSKNTAVDPSKLTRSKGFLELIEEHLPDSLLVGVHREGLAATRGNEPDFPTRHKYLETGYKIKGRLPAEAVQQNQFNLFLLSDEEIERRIADHLARARAARAGAGPAKREE